MKKFLYKICIFALLLSLLAGCSVFTDFSDNSSDGKNNVSTVPVTSGDIQIINQDALPLANPDDELTTVLQTFHTTSAAFYDATKPAAIRPKATQPKATQPKNSRNTGNSSTKPPSAVDLGNRIKISGLSSKNIDYTALINYYSVTDRQKEIYYALVQGARGFECIIALPEGTTGEDLQKAFAIMSYTCPDIFWVDGSYTFTTGSVVQATLTYKINGITIKKDSPQNDIDRAKSAAVSLTASIKNRIDEIKLYDKMTKYDMEFAIHDWLSGNLSYDPSNTNASNIYGAIFEKKAVCGGYSRAFQYILGLIDIKSLFITGSGRGENHIWNAVLLDGDWYNVDVTWNNPQGKTKQIVHTYFNRTDTFINEDHKKSGNLPNPSITCTATKYDYYKKSGTYITNDAEFKSVMQSEIAAAKEANGFNIVEAEIAKSYFDAKNFADKLKIIDTGGLKDMSFISLKTTVIFIFKFK